MRLRVNILNLLKQKGKTKYWLYIQTNMTYTNFYKIITNQTKSIKFENIALFCKLLDCTPNDLFVYVTEEQAKIEDEALLKARSKSKQK